MDSMTIDQVIAALSRQLHLSKEAETEVLAEIRAHLEDALADAERKGEDSQAALLQAAEQYGFDEALVELQEIHIQHESIDAIAATALPVLFALILRWLVFAPDGTALAWEQVLARTEFWIVALAALFIPLYSLHRRRFALAAWGIFWLLTVIFITFPSINHW
jgi:hypothetical protein